MLHNVAKGVVGSVAFKLPDGDQLNLTEETVPFVPPRRLVFSRNGRWWLVLADVRSHRARLPSGEIITEAEHRPHCDTIEGDACLCLSDFVAGKVKFDRFTLLYRFTETDLVAHPCVMLPIPDDAE